MTITPSIDKLIDAINKGIIESMSPINNSLLSKILEGAKNSEAFPQGFLKYLP